MKIAIITNVPDKNSPMFSSFIQFADKPGNTVYSSSIFKLNDYLNSIVKKHNYIHLQKYKLQYFFIFPAIIILIYRALILIFDKSYINKRKYRFRNLFFDFYLATKRITNNLALNFDHLIFLFRVKPDFVVCCCVAACNAARFYRFFFRKNFSYSIYEVYPNHNKDYLKYILYKYNLTLEEKKACTQCAFVISPATNNFGRLLKLRYNIPELKIVSLFFTHNSELSFSRGNVDFPVKLYYHGMFDRQRHLPEFIAALHNCNSDRFHLYLRGQGPELDLIQKTISTLKMEQQVSLLPFLATEKLPAAAQEFDIGLSLVAFDSPNNRFLIGFKSTDYLRAGLCQLGPDSYILGNMLKTRKIGFTYRDTTVEGFTKVLAQLINEPQKIEEYKANARQIATEEATFPHCQNKFLSTIGLYVKPEN